MLGGLVPRKSSTGSTMPRPSRWNQMRFAAARAKYGLSGAVSQSRERARGVRVGWRMARPAGELRLHRSPGPRVRHLPVALRQDRLLLVVDLDEERAVAVLDAGEERGDAVVVVLRPVLAGVVVALRAPHPHAQEQLRDPPRPAAPGCGAGGRTRPAGSSSCRPAAVRIVRANSSSGTFAAIAPRTHWWYFTAPILPTNRWFTPSRSAHFSAHQSANSGQLQQRVDQLRPLRRVGVGEERPHLVGRRQAADRVEVRPADELLVGAERGRLDPQQLQLREDVRIDVVPLRRVGPAEVGFGSRNRTTAGVISPMYSAVTTTSPGLDLVTVPSGPTRAASSSLTVNRVRCVTSRFDAVGERGDDLQRQRRRPGRRGPPAPA